MSDTVFRKPRRNYREKKDDSEDEKEDEEPSVDSSLPIKPSVVTPKMSTLSFDDDLNESDQFKVKKPSHSRRIVKQLKVGQIPSKYSEAVGKISRPQRPPKPSPIKVENIEKSSSFSSQLSTEVKADLSDIPKVKPLPRASSEQFTSMLKQGVIPDASAIHLARKQRQQAKFLLDAEKDVAPVIPQATTINDGRRLIREDDDDEDIEDDELPPLSLGAHSQTQRRPAFQVGEYRDPDARRIDISRGLHRREDERRLIREDFVAVEHGSDRDSDNETKWEQQQIQKAISNQNSVVLGALQPEVEANGESDFDAKVFSQIDYGDITLSSLTSLLKARQAKLENNVRQNREALVACEADLSRGQELIKSSRSQLPDLANSLIFYQGIREYTQDVIDCFNEKMTKIEYLERRSIILYRERSDNLNSRRRLDMRDMADEVSIGSGSSDIKEDLKASEARRRRKADREARRSRRQRQMEAMNTTENPLVADRAKRMKSILGVLPPYNGMSTDDEESQAVIAKRKSDINDIIHDAQHIFEDVVDEYCALPAILAHFAEWRQRFPETYSKAYIALCLSQLIAPIIRLELLSWNPLQEDSGFLDEQLWFGHLVDYANTFPKATDVGAVVDPEIFLSMAKSPDQELSLLPSVIEKIILARLKEIVAASWDPLSTTESIRLTKLVRSLAALWPTVNADSKPTKLLFEAIVKRMEQTIQEDIFIPLYPKSVLAIPQSLGYAYFIRQLNASMKLYSNLMLWHDLIAPEALQHITLTCLLNRYILVGFASMVSVCTLPTSKDGGCPTGPLVGLADLELIRQVAARLKAIVARLPPAWLTEPPATADRDSGQASSDLFSQLHRFIDQLVSRLSPDKSISSVRTQVEVELLPILKKFKHIKSRLLAKDL